MTDFNIFGNIYFWIKIVVLIAVVFYIIFSVILLNQVRTMNRVIKQPSSSRVEVVAKLNLIFSAFLFLLALVIL